MTPKSLMAKDFLSRARLLNEQIESNLRLCERLRGTLGKCTVSFEKRFQGGKTGDFGKTVEKIVDLEKKLNDETDRLVDLLAKIKEVIGSVPDDEQRLILFLRYVEFMKWEEIAQRLNYSLSSVHRLHRRALESAGAVIFASDGAAEQKKVKDDTK